MGAAQLAQSIVGRKVAGTQFNFGAAAFRLRRGPACLRARQLSYTLVSILPRPRTGRRRLAGNNPFCRNELAAPSPAHAVCPEK